MMRVQAAILAIIFLTAGGATVVAPQLWEHYGIALTTPRAINQFVSVVSGAELGIGLICAYVCITGRIRFNIFLILAIILGSVSIIRPLSFVLHGGASLPIIIEWTLEVLGAILCYRLSGKPGD